jgi:8-oxo-dGTP diphosphatase
VEGVLEWVCVNDLQKYPLVEDLPILLPKVLSMEPSQPPFSARYHYDETEKLVITFAPQ